MVSAIPVSLSCIMDSKIQDSRFHQIKFPNSRFQKQTFCGFRNLQWGTKVLTHFCKMAPFFIVDKPIPFPSVPLPPPPKINIVFYIIKSFFNWKQHWFRGGGIWGLWTQSYVKGRKLLLKASVLDECINYLCPWLWIPLPGEKLCSSSGRT